jgi:NAD(P)H dehydrogenase (quinone)
MSTQPGKVVCLSIIGAQSNQPTAIAQLQIMEQEFGDLPMPIAFLRAALDTADMYGPFTN